MIRSNALAAALILASGNALAWGDGCTVSAERSLELGANGIATLDLLARAGDLRVEGSSAQAGIVVTGKACASSQELLDAIQLREHRSGDRQTVEAVMPETGGWGNDQASIDLVVKVPARLALELQDSSGDAEVRGLAALEATDSSGDFDVRDVAGNVTLTDSSGDLEVQGIGGDVHVRVDSSGDMTIAGVRGNVQIDDDSSGSIALQDIQGDAAVDSDSSGEIEFDRIGGSASVGSDSSGSIRANGVARDFSVRKDGSGDIEHHDVQGKVSIPAS
jgi:hypothetical protein